jgi:preprotein translocase subunit SecD
MLFHEESAEIRFRALVWYPVGGRTLHFIRRWRAVLACAAIFILSAWPIGAMAQGADQGESGLYLVVKPETTPSRQGELDAIWPEIRRALRQERDTIGTIRKEPLINGTIVITPSKRENIRHAWKIISNVLVSHEVSGNMSDAGFDVRVEMGRVIISFDAETTQVKDRALVEQSVIALGARFQGMDVPQAQVTSFMSSFIQVVIPQIGSPGGIGTLIEMQAELSGHQVISRARGEKPKPGPGKSVLPDRFDGSLYYVLEDRSVFGNELFKSFEASFDRNGRPAIRFMLTPEGIAAFDAVQDENPGGLTAYVLDGEVISALRSDLVRIPPDEGMMVNDAGMDETEFLSKILNMGALPARMAIVQYRDIGPNRPVK